MNIHPLSNAQKRIWFTQKKYENSSLFNIGGIVKINGILNIGILQQAIKNTIGSNPALRFRLIEKNNEVFQYVASEPCTVDFIDFSDDENAEEKFMQWYAYQAKTPFEMIGYPLYYFSVFKINKYQMGYLIKLHHIIADGWSIKLLTDQITDEYEKIASGNMDYNESDESLLANKPSYITYIQNEESQLMKMDKAKEYWNEMYYKMPELSTSCGTSLNGKRKSFIPDDAMQLKIEAYIKEHNISINTFIVFVYTLYTYKKFGIKDLIVGIPLLGRKGKVERQTFGTFTNTMPYRFIVDEKEMLVDVLKNISMDLKNIIRYQYYPYNLLHKDLKLTESGVGSLYNICVNYYNTRINNTIGGVPVENIEFYNGQQEYALQIIIRHWNDIKMQLDYDYQTDVYSDKQIEDMYQQFIIIMNQLFADEGLKVEDLVLINDEDKVRFLESLQVSKQVQQKDTTWVTLFNKVRLQNPNKIAISKDNEAITYQELDQLSNRIANHMVLLGIKSGDVVAIRPEYDIKSIAIILAIMKCGGVYLPIDSTYPIGRVNEILQNAEVKYYIAKEYDANYKGKFLSYKELMSISSSEEYIDRSKPLDLAYIIYTSGSTGEPKGVMITHRNFVNYLSWAKENYIKQEKEVFALYSSFSFDFTMTSIFLPLISGNEIRIYNNTIEDNVFTKIIEDNKVTILKVTPSHITLIQDVKVNNSKLHTFIVGGENFKTAVCEHLYKQFNNSVSIYNEYGPTEATIGCMIYRYNNDTSESISIGGPIANTTIYILDQDMMPVPNNTIGEIYIGGDSVSKGYYKANKETSERFLISPYRESEVIFKTGDMAYRDESGNIYFCGRKDNEVKINGNRINISGIEQRILSSNMVRDVFVNTINNRESVQLSAYVVPNEQFSLQELKKYLREYLPEYMVPYHITTLDEFPLTINGKIDVNSLPNPLSSHKEKDRRKAIKEHEVLLNAVRDIIHEEIILEDNFYSVGGDSIKAIQISSQLSKQGYELSVQNILSHPFFYDLVYYVREKKKTRYEQIPCDGEIRYTPILSWFFEQNFEEEGHYNQSVLLEIRQMISLDVINKVFNELLRHHDILRMNYDKQTGKLYYNKEHLNAESFVQVINLEGDRANNVLEVIESNIRHDFDLKRNLLIKPYLLVSPNKCYLYIATHHLVVDGVSWRILLDDISTMIKQTISGQPLLLPEKTISYAQFANKYKEWSTKRKIDADYWKFVLNAADNPFCVEQDYATYSDTVRQEILFSKEITDQLLGSANDTYHTKTNELLLIAIMQVVNQTCLMNELVMVVEGHGRDVLESEDTNRTIGWFTNRYPIKLRIPECDMQTQIKSLKDQIRKGTSKGYEYSILRYIKKWAIPDKKMICFNYLGEYKENKNDFFELKEMMFDSNISGKNQIPYIIDINGVVINSQLKVYVHFNKNMFSSEYISKFVHCFENNVINIVEHCVGLKEEIFTTTDFDSIEITQEELDNLLKLRT
ncbi:non-ribosomal peptide synthetase [Anaerosporobacter faecicola]|uniref:non-ribosomal peptide synthetase n=1 Tax=Anaerosporobacter faecicola TaxID=2718714 RepID=UPI00143B112D|nr:non-ribosomal peptide synthetase [Anaerosporobacter faecicola]